MKGSYLIKYVLWRTFPSVYSQGGRKFNLPFWIVKELLTMLLHKRLSMVLDSKSNGKTNTKSKKKKKHWSNCRVHGTSHSDSSIAKLHLSSQAVCWNRFLLLPMDQHRHYYEKHWIVVLFVKTLTLFSLEVLFESHFSALTSVSLHSGQREMIIFFSSSGLSDAMITEDALETVLCFLMLLNLLKLITI